MVVSVVGVQGSAPREIGARMTVTLDTAAGSIGGGTLEHMAIQRARTLLRRAATDHCLVSFPLAPDTDQCCGGVVVLLFEPLSRTAAVLAALADQRADQGVATLLGSDRKLTWHGRPPASLPVSFEWPQPGRPDAQLLRDGDDEWLLEHRPDRRFVVALFGAGHVGRALIRVLAPLPCRVLWLDERADQFPSRLPDNVERIVAGGPAHVASLPAASLLLIMTHRHTLDYQLCELALQREDLPYVGLIGSATKRRRFEKALCRAGLPSAALQRLVCPIGLPGISGKQPAVIALSVAAQLLEWNGAQEHSVLPKPTGISEQVAAASRFADAF